MVVVALVALAVRGRREHARLKPLSEEYYRRALFFARRGEPYRRNLALTHAEWEARVLAIRQANEGAWFKTGAGPSPERCCRLCPYYKSLRQKNGRAARILRRRGISSAGVAKSPENRWCLGVRSHFRPNRARMEPRDRNRHSRPAGIPIQRQHWYRSCGDVDSINECRRGDIVTYVTFDSITRFVPLRVGSRVLITSVLCRAGDRRAPASGDCPHLLLRFARLKSS